MTHFEDQTEYRSHEREDASGASENAPSRDNEKGEEIVILDDGSEIDTLDESERAERKIHHTQNDIATTEEAPSPPPPSDEENRVQENNAQEDAGAHANVPATTASATYEEEKGLIEAQEVYTLSRITYDRPSRVKTVVKGMSLLMILLFSLVGILSVLFFVFVAPRLFNYHTGKVRDLESRIGEKQQEIMRAKEEIGTVEDKVGVYKSLLFEYKYLLSMYRLRISKGAATASDLNLDEDVEANLNLFREKVTTKGTNVFRGNTARKEIALTFDTGTGRDLEYLLELVRRFKILVTVFLSNETPLNKEGTLFKESNIEYIKALADEGCEFGSHTWSHYNLSWSLYETSYHKRLKRPECATLPLSFEDLAREFLRVEEKYEEITGKKISKIWRAPYGSISDDIVNAAATLGYETHFMWTVDMLDYVSDTNDEQYYSSDAMYQKIVTMESYDRHGMNGVITLCHLGSPRTHDKMIHILPDIITHFKQKGYTFVTASQVLR